jgi:hypothetical protein
MIEVQKLYDPRPMVEQIYRPSAEQYGIFINGEHVISAEWPNDWDLWGPPTTQNVFDVLAELHVDGMRDDLADRLWQAEQDRKEEAA